MNFKVGCLDSNKKPIFTELFQYDKDQYIFFDTNEINGISIDKVDFANKNSFEQLSNDIEANNSLTYPYRVLIPQILIDEGLPLNMYCIHNITVNNKIQSDTIARFIINITPKEPQQVTPYPKYKKPKQNFADNSWELISEIARYDDPSKYWKVGDYKMIEFPGISYSFICSDTYSDTGERIGGQGNVSNESLFLSLIDYKVGKYKVAFHTNDTYSIEGNGIYIMQPDVGASSSSASNENDYFTVEVKNTKAYPLQIIGFNHDKVTNPYTYGKQRAGITLQLGSSRSIYGDTKPSLYDGEIAGLMNSKGYFKSPNKVLSDFTEGVTNWANGGFRIALQNLFDNSDVANYMVEVQKYTSRFYNSSNYWASPMLTNDKVFLPSEWEIFGTTVFAPAQEGHQYEFYNDGYSKFMWHKDMLGDNPIKETHIWLRSTQGSGVSANTPDCNSTCCIHLKINTDSLGYSPSAASSDNRPGFIAPCICL